VKPWLSHRRRTPAIEMQRLTAPLAGLTRFFHSWRVAPWRAQEADPVSVFGQDPDDGPENEGLMRYGS
jgi:hypothetical protein